MPRLPSSLADSPAERISEIAETLAAGLMRLHARKSSGKSADVRESSLDCAGHQSGHGTPDSPEVDL